MYLSSCPFTLLRAYRFEETNYYYFDKSHPLEEPPLFAACKLVARTEVADAPLMKYNADKTFEHVKSDICRHFAFFCCDPLPFSPLA